MTWYDQFNWLLHKSSSTYCYEMWLIKAKLKKNIKIKKKKKYVYVDYEDTKIMYT